MRLRGIMIEWSVPHLTKGAHASPVQCYAREGAGHASMVQLCLPLLRDYFLSSSVASQIVASQTGAATTVAPLQIVLPRCSFPVVGFPDCCPPSTV